ncbi:hypothetical protein HDU93_002173 [Gonapodya sp. JEL0774]|nr:hypothetical protein HDU93_002173 [Gonapodya sp. JEL0774]
MVDFGASTGVDSGDGQGGPEVGYNSKNHALKDVMDLYDPKCLAPGVFYTCLFVVYQKKKIQLITEYTLFGASIDIKNTFLHMATRKAPLILAPGNQIHHSLEATCGLAPVPLLWTKEVIHIQVLEAISSFLGLKAFARETQLQGKTILLLTDNTASAYTMAKQDYPDLDGNPIVEDPTAAETAALKVATNPTAASGAGGANLETTMNNGLHPSFQVNADQTKPLSEMPIKKAKQELVKVLKENKSPTTVNVCMQEVQSLLTELPITPSNELEQLCDPQTSTAGSLMPLRNILKSKFDPKQHFVHMTDTM